MAFLLTCEDGRLKSLLLLLLRWGSNHKKRRIVELLETKDERIRELELEAERNRLLADDINRKLMETQLLLEAAEMTSRVI